MHDYNDSIYDRGGGIPHKKKLFSQLIKIIPKKKIQTLRNFFFSSITCKIDDNKLITQ